MTNPLCIHGKQSFERCVGCESDLLAGKSNGFTRELPPSKERLAELIRFLQPPGLSIMAHQREQTFSLILSGAAIEDIVAVLERCSTDEPSADAEKLLEAYDAAWIEDQQIGMCPPETVTISVITRAKQRFTTARAAVLAAMRASPPPAPERRCHHGFDVLVITTAYESGFGHGQNLDGLPNPYPEGSPEHHAYSIGYDEGERRRRMNGSSGYCNQGTHGACTNKECMCKCHSPTKEEERTADPDPWCDDCRAWQCHCEHNTRETK